MQPGWRLVGRALDVAPAEAKGRALDELDGRPGVYEVAVGEVALRDVGQSSQMTTQISTRRQCGCVCVTTQPSVVSLSPCHVAAQRLGHKTVASLAVGHLSQVEGLWQGQ